MRNIYIGSNQFKKIYLGSSPIKQVYLGSSLLYSLTGTVTYYTDTGSSTSQEFEYGANVLSKTVTKSGWTFLGWRQDKTASSSVLSSLTMGDSDITLYAVFKQNISLTIYSGSNTATTKTLTRYYNNGNTTNPTYALGSPATVSGYTAQGWNTTANSKTINSSLHTNGTADTFTANTTIYSVYKSSSAVTLTYYNGSTTSGSLSDYIYIQYTGSTKTFNPTFTVAQNAVSGWTKAGWTTSTSGYSATVSAISNLSLSANTTYYSLYTAKITITKYNGSTSTTTETKNRVANYHSSITYSNPSFTLTQNAVSGWTKAGWTTSTSGYSATISDGGSTGALSANATYYSLYTLSVTLTQYMQSPTATKTESKNRIANYHSSVTYSNPTFTLPALTDYSGYEKVGWTTNNSTSDYTTTVASTGGNVTIATNTSYYTIYKQLVTVTYYNNSTTASTSTGYHFIKFMNGGVPNQFPQFNLTEASVSGWTARGWSTSNTGNASINYNNAATFTTGTNVTLYSLYSKTVTVTYNGNGASSGSTTSSTGTAYRNASGAVIPATITLASNGFTKTGYNFKYWGSSSTATSSVGATLSTSTDSTVYAIWEQQSVQVLTSALSFTVVGTTAGSPDRSSVNLNSNVASFLATTGSIIKIPTSVLSKHSKIVFKWDNRNTTTTYGSKAWVVIGYWTSSNQSLDQTTTMFYEASYKSYTGSATTQTTEIATKTFSNASFITISLAAQGMNASTYSNLNIDSISLI